MSATPSSPSADDVGGTRGRGTGGESVPRGAVIMIAVLVGSAFVMVLNETILSVALRALSVDLGVSTTTVQWLTSGFLLVMAVVIPVTGFLMERFTPRTIFIAAMTLFSGGTLLSALAQSFPVLLTGRMVQAGGSALVLPMLMTTVMRLVPPSKRGATLGTVTIVTAVAPALGPTIGGAVLSSLGWRWMFWLVLPLALASLAIGAFRLRLDADTRPVPLDVLSVLLSALGFGGLLYGLSSMGEGAGHGGGSGTFAPWVPIAVGLAALTAFAFRQISLQRADRALLDLRPLTHRTFSVGLLLIALVFMAMMALKSILMPL